MEKSVDKGQFNDRKMKSLDFLRGKSINISTNEEPIDII